MNFLGLNLADGVINTEEAVIASGVDLSEESIRPSKKPLLKTSTPLVGKVRGIYQGGLVVAGGTLYKDFTAIATGFPDSPISFASFGDDTFIASGAIENKVYKGGVLRKMGINPPTQKLIITKTESGNLADGITSDYNYVYTFYDEANDRESAPSPPSDSITLNNDSIGLSGFEQSTNPQVSKRRIYRQGGTWTDYVFVAEIDNDNTIDDSYFDNIADVTLSESITSTTNYPPPLMTQIVAHDGGAFARLFGIGVDGVTLYYSDAFPFAEYWPLANRVIKGDKDDRIMWLESYHSSLIIFTNKRVLVMTGDEPGNFDFKELPGQPGLAAWQSVATSQRDNIFYLSTEGVRALTSEQGIGVKTLELKSEFEVDGTFGFYTETGTSGFYTETNQFGFYTEPLLGTEIGAFFENQYILTHRLGKVHILNSRDTDKTLKASFDAITDITALYNDGGTLLFGDSSGDVYEWGRGTRDSAFTYQSVQTDIGETNRRKRINRVELDIDASNLAVSLLSDGVEKATATFSTTGREKRYLYGGLGSRGRRFSLKFVNSDGDANKIYGFKYDAILIASEKP